MSWWQEYQGFFMVGALIVLSVAAVLVRARMRSWTGNVAQAAAEGKTWQDNPDPSVAKTLDSLATVVHLPIDTDAAAGLLAGAKLPMFWKHPEPREWYIPVNAADPTPATIARLEPAADGCEVRLVQAQEMASIPQETDWRKLRRSFAKAAEAQGVAVTERTGAPLARTPTTDVSHLTSAEAARTPHIWRPAPQAGPDAG
jgi:hypothetical protein